MEKMCRICLKTFEKKDNELKSVFEDEDDVKIAKKIFDISGVYIEENESVPDKVCKPCLVSVRSSYDFVKLIHKSYKKSKADETEDDLLDNKTLKVEPDSDLFHINQEIYNISNDLHDDTSIKPEEKDEKIQLDDDDDEIKNLSLNLKESVNELKNSENLLQEKTDKPKKTRKSRAKPKQEHKKRKSPSEKLPRRTPEELLEMYNFLKLGENMKTFICTLCECELSLFSQSAITRHMKTEKHVHNEGVEIRRNLGFDERKIINHRYNCKDEQLHICEVCGLTFKERHILNQHWKRLHSDEDQMKFECKVCDRKFRVKIQLTRHMSVHTGEKRYSCKFCNKPIRLYSCKIRHERTHTGERPYKCSVCDKAFTASHVLNNHMKTHSGEKQFACLSCNRTFTLRDQYIKHLKSKYHKKRADPASLQDGNVVLTNIVPNNIMTNNIHIVPNNIVPNNIVPNNIVPNNIVPNNIVPNNIVPNNTVSNNVSNNSPFIPPEANQELREQKFDLTNLTDSKRIINPQPLMINQSQDHQNNSHLNVPYIRNESREQKFDLINLTDPKRIINSQPLMIIQSQDHQNNSHLNVESQDSHSQHKYNY